MQYSIINYSHSALHGIPMTYFITGSLYLFAFFFHFFLPSSLASGNHQSVLWNFELGFFVLGGRVCWFFKNSTRRDAWVAQSVKRLTSAQVMISCFVSSRSALCWSQSLELAWHSVSPSLTLPCLHSVSLSLSQKWINIKKKKKQLEMNTN